MLAMYQPLEIALLGTKIGVPWLTSGSNHAVIATMSQTAKTATASSRRIRADVRMKLYPFICLFNHVAIARYKQSTQNPLLTP
jgi:hypothetical protein